MPGSGAKMAHGSQSVGLPTLHYAERSKAFMLLWSRSSSIRWPPIASQKARPVISFMDGLRPSWKCPAPAQTSATSTRSEEHTSELQSLMRISYAVFCLQKKKKQEQHTYNP